MDYVIKNGTVCLEGEHFRADVTVREGKIQALGKAVHNGHRCSYPYGPAAIAEVSRL